MLIVNKCTVKTRVSLQHPNVSYSHKISVKLLKSVRIIITPNVSPWHPCFYSVGSESIACKPALLNYFFIYFRIKKRAMGWWNIETGSNVSEDTERVYRIKNRVMGWWNTETGSNVSEDTVRVYRIKNRVMRGVPVLKVSDPNPKKKSQTPTQKSG